jgi:hypothetical protein
MSHTELKQSARPLESAPPPPNVPDTTPQGVPGPFEGVPIFRDTLEDAERLLKYAAEIGIEVESDIRSGVLKARAAFSTGWTETTAANLLASLTKLAARLKPVTAESLKVSKLDAKTTWPIVSSSPVSRVPSSACSVISRIVSQSRREAPVHRRIAAGDCLRSRVCSGCVFLIHGRHSPGVHQK